MYKLLIVTALSQEAKSIKKTINKLHSKNLELLYLTTGMGSYAMIRELTYFLTVHKDIDFIVNIGVCGYKEKSENFINIARIKNLHNKKELIVPQLLDFENLDSIVSSEIPVTNYKILGDENYVDMESYGFEFVCEKFKLPRAILKVPTDKVGDETINYDYKGAVKKLSENIHYEQLLESIYNYLEKNKKSNLDIEYIYEHYRFTFTEKVIFEKLFQKFQALTGEDFKEYFLENKDLNKKDFLKNLEKYLYNYTIR